MDLNNGLQGAGFGARVGSSFGPIGTAIGGLGGFLLGGLGSSNKRLNPLKIAQPLGYNAVKTPLGSLRYSHGSLVYSPKESRVQRRTNYATDSTLLKAVQAIPSALTVDDLFNNRFYKQEIDNALNSLNQRRREEERDLTNDLNARNQLGSSFDALQRNLFNRRFDTLRQEAETQARNRSVQAYQQQLDSSLSTLAALRNLRSEGLRANYAPMEQSLGRVALKENYGFPMLEALKDLEGR